MINDLAAGSYLVYATALDAPLYGFFADPFGAPARVRVAAGETTPGIDIHLRQAAAPPSGAAGSRPAPR